MNVSTEELLEELHALRGRVAHLEDELSVRRVIAAYGPLADSGDAEATGRLWAEEAVYDMDVGTLNGRAEITEMVDGPVHQEIIGGGAAHANGPVVVELNGDTAVATGHSQLFRGDGSGGFYVWRIAANRWELARGAGGWQVTRRTTRLLDGRPDARELLRRAGRSDGAAC
ncbi:nuclear transport factor 2 family protein [Spirillospora sp. NPDC052242]